ncbi:hypothetical protein ZV79_160 [Salmonella enterica subsp. enterica serovar Typhimurium]|nr:hypothetical protein [Salmonella enterica]AKG29063.1 hypothetical protein ZV79_160 [Salmonella enterica subsp. enterica serovar Typhimurium]ESH91134.1 hypothetical protein SEEA1822_16224 [Salmonella enterica subsp. enterica serovar Agona str. 632182-2]ESJ44587.1 hypothetical protein CFSAN001082_08004 [Salmonella enterica subsp. enterica serovar Havana str. CFSAN001082]OSJ71276.1 hypothetical protein K797_10376 [Salmonella enterica subsp. enterica serovar Newport str. SHSN008]CAH2823895.1 hy
MLCGNADAAAKLQYLHVTNGGMMAFYDDGNAKMCARCEPMVQNLKSMNNKAPYARWKQMGDVIKLKSPNGESDYKFYQQGEILSTWWIFNYKTLHALVDLSE